jgi:hypothetical protein
LAFGVTIYAFFITKLNSSGKHSHSYKVSTWTYFVAMIIQAAGLVYTGIMTFSPEWDNVDYHVVLDRKKEILMS